MELPVEPIQVCCDRSQIETALINLLENALKFTPAGGQVQVGASGDVAAVEIWVKDNGPGIPTDELPHVFERFYRGRQVIGEGSGLGLAIAQSIVHAHGGQVDVVSQVGVGSRFTIKLPVEA
jgi:signal transduction histidine kinase